MEANRKHNEAKNPIRSNRQQEILNNAIKQLQASGTEKYISAVYLYGSCARGEERWDSDVDLFVQLTEDIREIDNHYRMLRELKTAARSEDCGVPAVDMHFYIGTDWTHCNSAFFKEIKRDGVRIW